VIRKPSLLMVDTYSAETQSVVGDQLIAVSASVRPWSADDVVDQFVELFTNSRVADEHDVIVAPCYVGRSQHAPMNLTVYTSSSSPSSRTCGMG